ncbi:hypothetical protein HZH66_011280 [Vespula vulgaris]|uniref:Uncharacterized protein n=1 Tax=Vespula vulgaris TaxID=7454 RepID=A0A834JEK7_VESVU|nr:hypothetical protein HZH66_011280 [Vespula vulgaris]
MSTSPNTLYVIQIKEKYTNKKKKRETVQKNARRLSLKQNQLSAQHHENMQIIFFWIPSLKLALKCICKWPKNVHRIIKIIMNDYINNSSWYIIIYKNINCYSWR